MPVWLLNLLISLALKWGVPFVLDWLRKRFPNLPLATVGPILEEYVNDLKEVKKTKHAARAKATQKLRECTGVGCPIDIKRI